MSNRIFVATRKGLFTVERSGGRWAVARTAFLGDSLTIVLPDGRDGSVYAALHHGHFGCKLQRSRDDGATWQELAVPVYPPQPEGEVDKDMWGRPIPWKLDRVWALEAGHADQPGRLWCGTLPGGLFRSDDGGVSWELVGSLWFHPKRKQWMGGGADLPGIHSICIHPADSRRLAIGVSTGGVWHTDDDGGEWRLGGVGLRAAYMPPEQQHEPLAQDVHRLVQCPASPQHLWIQHHNGVFRTTDAGARWEEVTTVKPSVFGFAVAVHPRDPDTAWFVPGIKDEQRIPVDGKVVVSRTRDGGRTFDVLRDGLPQEHAYDLTFRHGLDVDETGDRLAFGSTTGGLWVSEDQGDSWQCVSTHLPPVYCVRFAKPLAA